jgi:hypothetical protein
VRALAAEGATFEDRRRLVLASGVADVANRRHIGENEAGFRCERTFLATAGDRVCLERWLWTGGPAEGRIEIEHLLLTDVGTVCIGRNRGTLA